MVVNIYYVKLLSLIEILRCDVCRMANEHCQLLISTTVSTTIRTRTWNLPSVLKFVFLVATAAPQLAPNNACGAWKLERPCPFQATAVVVNSAADD